MSNTIKIIVFVAVALVAGALIHFGLDKYNAHREKVRDKAMVNAVDKKTAEIKANAAKNYPNEPDAIAYQKEAAAEAGSAIQNAGSAEGRRNTAVGAFYGFYLVNVRSRVDYCIRQGVNIDAFTTPSKSNNAPVLAVAAPLLTTMGMDQDKLYATLKTQISDMVETDMKGIAANSKTDAKGACQLMATNGGAIAEQMRFSKMLPEAYQVLMGAQ